jgi:dipeptidase
MKTSCPLKFLTVFLLVTFGIKSFSCTTMIITKGASADGSMMVAHSDDDDLMDQRLIFVPSRKQSGKRKIYHEHYSYPRIVTNDRGPGYDTPGFSATPVLYELPYEEIWDILGYKVETSYAYFDGNYGIMNEHNLMIGECTDGAKFVTDANTEKGNGEPLRIFYSCELSRIALENCKTAREAVELIGGLIDRYGFYSMGETLLLGDGDEAWVIEMCSLPDDDRHSAWVAQRVPDGEVFVAANEFRIRYIVKDDPDNFMYSEHLIPGLKKVGWWDEEKDGTIDWLRAVSYGEIFHPYYCLRRIWRLFDRINPDLGLSPWVEDAYTMDYPFSVKPKYKLHLHDVFALYRDHYEGTQFDLTKGIAAGPYGAPQRFLGSYDREPTDVKYNKKIYGAWERPMSVYYQGYTFVCQHRPDKPVETSGILWFGSDVAYTTCFTPFSAKITELTSTYQAGDPQKYDRSFAFWAFNFVNNWSRLNFQQMTKTDIIPLQHKLEEKGMEFIKELDEMVGVKNTKEAREIVTEQCNQNADKVIELWWELADMLIAKYSDGLINLPFGNYTTPHTGTVREAGYPSWWLDKTNYREGPVGYEMK